MSIGVMRLEKRGSMAVSLSDVISASETGSNHCPGRPAPRLIQTRVNKRARKHKRRRGGRVARSSWALPETPLFGGGWQYGPAAVRGSWGLLVGLPGAKSGEFSI